MSVVYLDVEDKRWQSFLAKTPHFIFHTPEYKQFFQSAFKAKILCLAAGDESGIRTLFPVVLVKHPVFGTKLISTAFLEYGGPCGEMASVPEIIRHLEKDYSHACKYLEVRQGLSGYEHVLSGVMQKCPEYKRFVLDLGREADIWQNIQREKRKAVRKAQKEGVIVRETAADEVNEVYDLYCQNMRSFGSPPFPKSYFVSLFENLVPKQMSKIFGAYVGGKLASFLLGFLCQDRIHIVISVSQPEYLKYRTNDALHWHFIKFGCDHGFKYFDFGRVRPDSGQFEYKKKWGASLLDLDHFYLLWKTKSIPRLDPENSRYSLYSKLWKRLPISLTRRIGPWLREGLGI
jgi:FemAB-related protein (PEP-CTERM system-associated)